MYSILSTVSFLLPIEALTATQSYITASIRLRVRMNDRVKIKARGRECLPRSCGFAWLLLQYSVLFVK